MLEFPSSSDVGARSSSVSSSVSVVPSRRRRRRHFPVKRRCTSPSSRRIVALFVVATTAVAALLSSEKRPTGILGCSAFLLVVPAPRSAAPWLLPSPPSMVDARRHPPVRPRTAMNGDDGERRRSGRQRRGAVSLCAAAAASGSSGGGEPDFSSSDPFRVLGLTASPTLDKKQIKRAYRRLALRYHPDVATSGKDATPADKREASDRFAKINWAYQVLSGKEQQRTAAASGAGASSSAGGGGGSSSGWTPPHRRTSSYTSPSSSSGGGGGSGSDYKSTDWRDYIPYNSDYDDDDLDAGGDSFSAIFRDLFVGAASGGAGLFTDFVEFLEENADGYGLGGGGGSSYGGGSGGGAGGDDLRILLQTGTVEEIGEEMDDTELVVQQLVAKSSSLDDELVTAQAELQVATRYSAKIDLQEKIEEVRARQKVIQGYLGKARKRLLSLQTRYKELIVNGDNDPVAGGGSRRSRGGSSRTWSRNTASTSAATGSSQSGSYGAPGGDSSGSTQQQRSRRHENPDDAWKDDSFGSFGRGRGSGSRRRRASSRQQQPSASASRSSSSSSTSSSYRYSPSPPPPPPSSSSPSSSSSSSRPSSGNKSSADSSVPPHRRSSSQAYAQDDQKRLRELKVDEEFDKLKKDLGLL